MIRGARVMHTMLRVQDIERTLAFYCGVLGMSVQMERTDPDGYRNVFVGYGPGPSHTLIEFGWRPGHGPYDKGAAFDHIALEVADANEACTHIAANGGTIVREARKAASGAQIAIIEDPDGYRIELIQPKT